MENAPRIETNKSMIRGDANHFPNCRLALVHPSRKNISDCFHKGLKCVMMVKENGQQF